MGDFVARLMRLSETFRRLDEANLRLLSIRMVEFSEGQEAIRRFHDELRNVMSNVDEAWQAVSDGLKDLTE